MPHKRGKIRILQNVHPFFLLKLGFALIEKKYTVYISLHSTFIEIYLYLKIPPNTFETDLCNKERYEWI